MLAVGTLRQLTKSADPIPSTDTGWQLPDNPRGRLPSYRPSGEDSGTP